MESWRELPGMFIEAMGRGLGSAMALHSDVSSVEHHVHNGGCKNEFAAAVGACQTAYFKELEGDVAAADTDACVKATAALHKCFCGNREWFKHQFISRLEEGLDQDRDPPPSPEQVRMEYDEKYRWWTGMRRS
jgi:hypothetical protein